MKIVFLLCLYNSKMKLMSGCGKICQFEGVEGVLLPCICNYVVSLCIADLSSFSLNNDEGECIYKCLVMRLPTQSNMIIQYYSCICSGGS